MFPPFPVIDKYRLKSKGVGIWPSRKLVSVSFWYRRWRTLVLSKENRCHRTFKVSDDGVDKLEGRWRSTGLRFWIELCLLSLDLNYLNISSMYLRTGLLQYLLRDSNWEFKTSILFEEGDLSYKMLMVEHVSSTSYLLLRIDKKK